jgi:hypothetical protein
MSCHLIDPVYGDAVVGGAGNGTLTRVACSSLDIRDSKFRCVMPRQAANIVVRYRIEYQMAGQVSIVTRV